MSFYSTQVYPQYKDLNNLPEDTPIIELSLECEKLINMDYMSKTDCFVRVFSKNVETKQI